MSVKKEPGVSIERYTVPRPISKEDEPWVDEDELVLKARIEVMKKYGSIVQTLKIAEPALRKFNEIDESIYLQDAIAAAEAARREGRPFLWTELQTIRARALARRTDAIPWPQPPPEPPEDWVLQIADYIQRNPVLELMQNYLERLELSLAYIDQVRPLSLCPGGFLRINGLSFEDNPGRVIFNIAPTQVVDLEILPLGWTRTQIWARLSSEISGFRPHIGSVFVRTASGKNSNDHSLRFCPDGVRYKASWTKCILSSKGVDWNDTFLKEHPSLGDPDFSVQSVTRSHLGGGWSRLQEPFAGGQNLAQGVHIGLSALEAALEGAACVTLEYSLDGPKGVPPPNVPNLTWAFDRETGCPIVQVGSD